MILDWLINIVLWALNIEEKKEVKVNWGKNEWLNLIRFIGICIPILLVLAGLIAMVYNWISWE